MDENFNLNDTNIKNIFIYEVYLKIENESYLEYEFRINPNKKRNQGM